MALKSPDSVYERTLLFFYSYVVPVKVYVTAVYCSAVRSGS